MITLNIPTWIYPLLIWELIWKGIALWYAAKNKQVTWFIILLITNTIGLIPIIYLLLTKEKKEQPKKQTRKTRKPSK